MRLASCVGSVVAMAMGCWVVRTYRMKQDVGKYVRSMSKKYTCGMIHSCIL